VGSWLRGALASVVFAFALGGLAPLAPPAAAAPGIRYLDPIFETVDVSYDIPYRTATAWDGSTVTLRADVYAPHDDTATARRVVVLVHGGGFVAGSKASMAHDASEFAHRGYVAVAVDYRLRAEPSMSWCTLAPGGPECDPRLAGAISDAQADVGAAVDVIRQQQASMHIDPDAIALYGGSAGAVTSLYLGHGSIPGSGGAPSATPRVAAVVSLVGVIAAEDVRAGAAPQLLIHGTADTVVPYDAVQASHAAALAKGDDSRLVTLPGAGHSFDAAQIEVAARNTLAFLDDVLQPGGRDRVEMVFSGGVTGVVAGRLAQGDIGSSSVWGLTTSVNGAGTLATANGMATVSVSMNSLWILPIWFGSIRVSGGGMGDVSTPVLIGPVSANAAAASGTASWFTSSFRPYQLRWSVTQG